MERTVSPWDSVARSAARFAKGSAILSVLLPAAAILFNLLLRFLGLSEGALLAELLVRVEYCLVPVGMMVWGACIVVLPVSLVVWFMSKAFAHEPRESGRQNENRWDARARKSASFVRVATILIVPLLALTGPTVPLLCVVSIPLAMVVNIVAKELARNSIPAAGARRGLRGRP